MLEQIPLNDLVVVCTAVVSLALGMIAGLLG